jgi:PITH domain
VIEGEDVEVPVRPKTIKIYTNRPHILGFDEAEDVQATQIITLGSNDWDSTGTANIALRFVKFQNITSLILFIVDGDGNGERVRLDRVRVIGEAGEKRDPGKLEKIGD